MKRGTNEKEIQDRINAGLIPGVIRDCGLVDFAGLLVMFDEAEAAVRAKLEKLGIEQKKPDGTRKPFFDTGEIYRKMMKPD